MFFLSIFPPIRPLFFQRLFLYYIQPHYACPFHVLLDPFEMWCQFCLVRSMQVALKRKLTFLSVCFDQIRTNPVHVTSGNGWILSPCNAKAIDGI